MATVSGAAALSAAAAVTVAGHRTAVAAAPFTAPGRLGASGASIQKGTAHLAAGASLGVAGTATALAAGSRLTVSGRVIKTGYANLAAAASMAAGGFVPALSAAASLTAHGAVTERDSAAFSAAAVLRAAPSSVTAHLTAVPVLLVPGRAGSAVLAAGTSLSASGQYFAPGTASLSSSAALAAAGRVTDQGSAALAAAARLTAAALSQPSSAHLAAGAALTAVPSSVAAHLAAAPSLLAAGRRSTGGAAALHAPGTLSASSRRAAYGSAALSANGTLTPHAVAVRHAAAAFSAAAVLAAGGRRLAEGSAHLTAPGSLLAAGRRTAAGRAVLAAPAALTAAGLPAPGAHLTGSPVLHAAGTAARRAQAALRAPGTLSCGPHGTVPASGHLQGAAVLSGTPAGVIPASALFAASCSMTVAGPDIRPRLPFPVRPAGPQAAWQRDVQQYAVHQERQRHAQALWQYGELAVFCLLWRPEDIGSGLAVRCTRCYSPGRVIAENPPQIDSGAAAEAQVSAAYGQGSQYRCALCYGTQVIAAGAVLVPGVRALLVRPAIITDTDQNQQRTAKGTVNPGSVAVQSTPDFRVNTLDYCFRSDGRRYQLAVPARTTLRTGFASPWQQAAAISYNLANAALEDPRASVAYLIPPSAAVLASALGTYTRIPADYAWLEQVNGPLIPGEIPPPAASGRYQPPVSLGSS